MIERLSFDARDPEARCDSPAFKRWVRLPVGGVTKAERRVRRVPIGRQCALALCAWPRRACDLRGVATMLLRSDEDPRSKINNVAARLGAIFASEQSLESLGGDD